MNVLVVESAPLVRRRISRSLRRLGLPNIVEADSGYRALGILGRLKPDVIVIGSDLAGMSSLLFALRIRMRPQLANVRLLMVTHKHDYDNVIDALRCGVDGYVAVPFPDDVLAEKVRQVMNAQASVASILSKAA